MEKDNKKRLMLMQEVLEKYTDEEHPLTTAQIIKNLFHSHRYVPLNIEYTYYTIFPHPVKKKKKTS